MRYLSIALIVCSFVGLTGCHMGGKTVVSANGTTMETSDDGKSVKIESKDGKMESKDGKTVVTDNKGNRTEMNADVSEADLGLPLYPGAKTLPGSMKTVSDGKKSVSLHFETPDSGQKIIDFYTAKLGKPKQTSDSKGGDGKEMTIAAWEATGRDISIIGTAEAGKTDCIILVVTK